MASLPVVEFFANDTHPLLTVTLDDGDPVSPTPVDLSLVLRVIIKAAVSLQAVSNKFVGDMAIVGDPVDGVVSYQFQPGELSAGGFVAEISVQYADYTVQTMGQFKLKVRPDLPNSGNGFD